jgi:hypothetical protein
MGIQINGSNDTISAADGSLSVLGADLTRLSQLSVSGVGTFSSLVVSGNASIGGTVTYMDVTNVDSVGIITAQQGIQVLANGINVTGFSTLGAVSASSLNVSGVSTVGVITGGTSIYAARLYGDGSSLTGISVGLTTETASPSNTVVFLNLAKQDHKVTASGITTISCTGGGIEGESHTVRIVNSGITTIGFSTNFLFPSGSVPVLPTTSGAISIVSFTVHRGGAIGLSTQLLAGASVNFS